MHSSLTSFAVHWDGDVAGPWRGLLCCVPETVRPAFDRRRRSGGDEQTVCGVIAAAGDEGVSAQRVALQLGWSFERAGSTMRLLRRYGRIRECGLVESVAKRGAKMVKRYRVVQV